MYLKRQRVSGYSWYLIRCVQEKPIWKKYFKIYWMEAGRGLSLETLNRLLDRVGLQDILNTRYRSYIASPPHISPIVITPHLEISRQRSEGHWCCRTSPMGMYIVSFQLPVPQPLTLPFPSFQTKRSYICSSASHKRIHETMEADGRRYCDLQASRIHDRHQKA